MSNDRVTAVYDVRVIASFVEHTHINAKNIGHVNRTAGSALVRADDHQMVGIHADIRRGFIK